MELNKFQGHIVLYCKGHYTFPEGDKGFFEGLKMIWAIRCGYDYNLTTMDTLTYIANDMYEILEKCMSIDKISNLIKKLHSEINPIYPGYANKPKDMSPIEAIIWEYRSMLNNLKIKEKDKITEEYIDLVKLPEPIPEIFNRILKGKGEYGDYWLIEPKKIS